DRARITVMLAANATGTEKLKPIVIGSSIEPHALAQLDRKFRLENRHILLLVDGATSHYNPNEDNDSNENSEEDMLESDKELNSEEESESESLNNEESYASSSRNPIRRSCSHPRLNVSNINKQSRRNSRSPSCSSKGHRGHARPYRLPEPTETPLTNIRIEFLPPHTTAYLQPMNAEYEEGDASDTDEEPPEVLAAEGLNSLKKFVDFFEQQKSDDFKVEDLKVFRKYVSLMGRKYVESLKQKSISDFFLP
ncbi:10380_t:CDS:2, partial [Scutellospora calospora]